MEAVAASVIAVLGTLLGAGLTHSFQRRAIERTERFTRGEKLRQERIDAYCAYAGALVNYRRILVDRWFSRAENRQEETEELRFRSYEMRSDAQEALFRVQLLTHDEELVRLAWETLDHVADVHRADDRDALAERRRVSREAINSFVATAKQDVA
ncbi:MULTISPECIES: hypothetical protein [Streptomyces]|uniref:Uncharacterized protein n=1 Tax=Streptomyces venezuelae TaxID=54571 RepID=A0A5P2BC36_STRVZ|nr:hypothetical protein [Streptomyces sp. SID335]MYZ14923.1 hypothetical protein [Streptomyces sp. SID337]NDZ90424.1 hypothetical protein [Streptomyces sp. SID10115]NDZ98409.1 hypothetical protein [Streptomyces sp. SID10116]NEB49503.1 hypothetical protein [Streptomyces sp. SID339]QES27846.1 hypothetical protein DEJ47_16615 [Streptomyces venezuelae]